MSLFIYMEEVWKVFPALGVFGQEVSSITPQSDSSLVLAY